MHHCCALLKSMGMVLILKVVLVRAMCWVKMLGGGAGGGEGGGEGGGLGGGGLGGGGGGGEGGGGLGGGQGGSAGRRFRRLVCEGAVVVLASVLLGLPMPILAAHMTRRSI
jgi:hypothetical protein